MQRGDPCQGFVWLGDGVSNSPSTTSKFQLLSEPCATLELMDTAPGMPESIDVVTPAPVGAEDTVRSRNGAEPRCAWRGSPAEDELRRPVLFRPPIAPAPASSAAAASATARAEGEGVCCTSWTLT